MKLKAHTASYITMADTFLSNFSEAKLLAQKCPDPRRSPEALLLRLNRYSIVSGVDAWTVAGRAGITRHAYDLGRDIHDAHIQTALQVIFPNAVFKDRKVY